MKKAKLPIPQDYEEDKVTEDYPGLIVHDGRVHGAITTGHSRLPLFCVLPVAVFSGFATVLEEYPSCAVGADELSGFVRNLFEQRYDFARLLCVLADVERADHWWAYKPEHVSRVRAALHACLEELDRLKGKRLGER
jgi:hypothetical protein